MLTFKEFINEVKISNTHQLKYFKLIQKALGSRTMDTDLNKGVLEVKYDTVSLFFKDGYLVGFRDENGDTFEVSRGLRSVKDLKSVRDIQKFLGAPKAPERMTKPTQHVYNYFPKNKAELRTLVEELIKERGVKADLNDIDVSRVTIMDYVFLNSNFNGDISKWDVSKVISMESMFHNSEFNGDISNWDVSKVKNMSLMFTVSNFNGDISKWDVSNVTSMESMFTDSKFNGDISKWDVSNVNDFGYMFYNTRFNGDLSKWKVNKNVNTKNMFKNSPLEEDEPGWYDWSN